MTTAEPTVAAIAALVTSLWADGLPTSAAYVSRRLREAGIAVDDALVTRACSLAPVPLRPEPR